MRTQQFMEGGYNLGESDGRATCIWYRMAYEFGPPRDAAFRWWMQITAAGRISDPLPCVVDDFGNIQQVAA